MSKKRLALLLSFAMISSFTAPAYAEAADFSAEATAETAEVYEAEDHADDDDIIAETADAEAEDSAVEETDAETDNVTVPAALADDEAEYLTDDWYDWDSVNGVLTLRGQLPDTFYDGNERDGKAWHNLAYHANISDEAIFKIVITSGTKAGTNASYMFCKMTNLTEIEGLENLDTSSVTDMLAMFFECHSLTSLDLSSFDTANVANMRDMFNGCSSLKTIMVSDKWNTENVTSSVNMFRYCTALVGGAGTKFYGLHTEKEYARIDGGTSAPGYLTEKWYSWDASTGTLTLQGHLPDTCYVENEPEHLKYHNLAYHANINAGDIKKIVITSDTKAGTNASYMFCNMTNLTEIEGLEYLDTSSVTNMYNMFEKCSSLTSLDLSSFDTSSVTDMTGMFRSCSSLSSVDLSSFDTSSVTSMCIMFGACSSLTSLDLSSFDTSSVTNMSHMFWGCSSLSSVDLSSFDTSSVTGVTNNASGMYMMFGRCGSLTSLDLSSFDTSSVIDMSYMFLQDSSLETITVSDKWNTDKVTDSEEMFQDCTALVGGSGTKFDGSHRDKEYARIDGGTSAPGYLTALCTYVDGTTLHLAGEFNKPGETKNTIAKALEKAGKSKEDIEEIIADNNAVFPADSSYLFSNYTSVYGIDLSKADTSAVTDMSFMFFECRNLTDCDLTGIDTSAVTNMGIMFFLCTGLESVDLSSLDTSAVTNMTSMFNGCIRLKSVGLPSDTSAVTDMSGMFSGCMELRSVDLSSLDTSAVTDMNHMFQLCPSLTTLDLSSFDTSSVTQMQGMFADCSSLTALDLGSFDTSNVNNMSAMFARCSSLASVDLSSFDTANVTDMTMMFEGCSALTTLDLTSFDTSGVANMRDMFKGCSSLKTITVSDKWSTDNVTYSADMLTGCTALVGSLGTKYTDVDAYDKTYAVVDGRKGQQGLLSGDLIAVTGVELDKTTAGMTPGQKLQLTATVSPDNADDMSVSWKSNNKSVATVNKSGLVTAVAAGTATITVTTVDGSKTATCEVTVTVPVTGVSLDQTTADMIIGDTLQLTETVAPSNATDKTVSWTSDDESIATVSDTGLVTAVAAGTTTITATTTDGGKTAECAVTVRKRPDTITFAKDNESLAVGESVAVKYTYEPDDADTSTIVWASTDESVVTVKDGVITAVGVGTAEISAKGSGTPAKMTVTVGASRPGKPTVEINIAFGGRTVKFDCDDEDAVIYYNIGSSNITTECKSVKAGESVFFDKPMTGNNAAIFFKAYNNGLWSPVGKWGVLNVQIAEPIIARSGRPSENNFRIYTQTKSSYIVYTLDGSTPTIEEGGQQLKVTNGRLVWGTSTIVKVGEGQTIKAIAVRSGLVTSDVMEYTNN